MKPAAFDYLCAESVPQALEALARASGDGKVIAGGQSLMPMINFRLAKPTVLVDINRIPGLDRIEDLGARLRIGALVRHRMTAESAKVARSIPVLTEAMKHVAHLTVRNRGTFCGSLCHADPAAEIPMLALLLDAVVHIAGPGGERTLSAAEFLVSSLTTALAPDELVTAVELAKPAPRAGWGFAEFARRHGDYALAAVCTTLERDGERARNVRVAVMGVGDTAKRLPAVEAVLEGAAVGKLLLEEAAALVRDHLEPPSDLGGSAAYRLHLAERLTGRVLREAWARAGERAPA